MESTRREFLGQGIATASLLATGATLPALWPQAAEAGGPGGDGRILVVVQLSGGNDGLNTLVPFRDDDYHAARPSLRIAADRVLRLDDDLGLHPEMVPFKRLYDDGLLSMVSNVGYPGPDRSHFRSMDIWHTASLVPEDARDGWLGRAIDAHAKASGSPLALHFDGGPLPLALRSGRQIVPSIQSVEAFKLHGKADTIARAIAAPRDGASEDLLFAQQTAIASCANARQIQRISDRASGSATYPGHGLARRLKQIALLIRAEFGPRIYYTSLPGFDTHARQSLAHGPLLRELSASVAAFFGDLKESGLADRVLLVAFSEFGRRVKENGSRGTDHGVAGPMFLAGPACKPGMVGGRPDLTDLDDGDIRHRVDFRAVYAAILERWLRIDHAPILGGSFKPVDVLG